MTGTGNMQPPTPHGRQRPPGAAEAYLRGRDGPSRRGDAQPPRDRDAPAARDGGGRGRAAHEPSEIPARGWWDIAKRTASEASRDNLTLVAAGVAFYALLAVPPALAAAISLWGLFADPAQVQAQIAQLADVLPAQAATVFADQLASVAARSGGALGWTVLLGLGLSLWSARLAVGAMIGALNVVYEERERRNFVKLTATALALTALLIVGGLVVLALLAGVPAVLAFVGLGSGAETLLRVLRWVALVVVVALGLAVLYRLGPSRRHARWSWVSWGAGIATALWIVASIGFSLFVASFGSYEETYGALGGVVVLLMWLWISAYVALLGAEINAEMEHQTARDTTEGPEKPMGTRGAWSADHVA